MDPSEIAAKVLSHVDVGRAIGLTQDVVRIPSVLGEEGPLAEFLADVMRTAEFQDVQLQEVVDDRPNAIGELRFGEGPRVLMTGHMDTKPVSRGWSVTEPFSGDLIDGRVYGHGIMDMKAALACQIVAIEAIRASGLPLAGTIAMAAVSDHMGDQLGSIRYFEQYHADLCVLGELSDNEIYLGHPGRFYFDVVAEGVSAHTCRKYDAVNANVLAAHAVLELDRSRLEPDLDPRTAQLFGAETMIVPGRIYGGLPPGGPSMIPDECVIRVDCRPQPGVTSEVVQAEIERCLQSARANEPRFEARLELVDVKSGYLADPESAVVQCMIEAVRQVRGVEPELAVAGWLGDTASFGDLVPTVIFGPGGGAVYCANESLPVEDIEVAARVYAVFGALALSGYRAP